MIGMRIVLCALVGMVAFGSAGCKGTGLTGNPAETQNGSVPPGVLTSEGEAGKDVQQELQSDGQEARSSAEQERRLL